MFYTNDQNPLLQIEEILKEEENFLRKINIIISCRENIWNVSHNYLRDELKFKIFNLKELTDQQINEIIKQIFKNKIFKNKILDDIPIHETIINNIKTSSNKYIFELIKNPLYLIILCIIIDQKISKNNDNDSLLFLPETKGEIYFYIVKLYEEHNNLKKLDKKNWLSIYEKLEIIALYNLENTEINIRNVIFHNEKITFSDIENTGWLIKNKEISEIFEYKYNFLHKTFEDFFAARAIVNIYKQYHNFSRLVKHFNNDKWREVLLTIEILPEKERLQLLKEIKREIDNSIVNYSLIQEILNKINNKVNSICKKIQI
ncbi:hypothetical protein HC766_05390 [Candidatus Gracilibacteria bacterium]|nr:hypothetical protein [Candidatus Gracilibacteria bacterium]